MDTADFTEHAPQREAAQSAIAEAAKPPSTPREYVQAVRQVTKALHRHGFGQTLAYMEFRASNKPNSPYRLLARQLDRWVLSTLAVKDSSALVALSTRNSRFYIEASEQAWLFIEALNERLKEVS
jgi:hypothetical protein